MLILIEISATQFKDITMSKLLFLHIVFFSFNSFSTYIFTYFPLKVNCGNTFDFIKLLPTAASDLGQRLESGSNVLIHHIY